MPNPPCSIHEALLSASKSATEEELIEVDDLFSDLGQPNGRAVLAAHTAAKNMVAQHRNISEAVLSSAARTIS